MEISLTDLRNQRLEALWREDQVTLGAWCTAIAASKEVQYLLKERGFDEAERLYAANLLAKAIMQTAPLGYDND